MYIRIPFTGLEVYAEWPSITKAPTFLHIASHRTAPDLVTRPGTVLVWIGRLHAVISGGKLSTR